MDGLKIVEYGLKAILILLDVGFIFCFFLCMAGTVMEIRRIIREWNHPPAIREKPCALLFFVIGVICGLLSVVLSGLVLMRWWT